MNEQERDKPVKHRFDSWQSDVLEPVLARTPERQRAFRTASGIEVKRLYTPLDLADHDYLEELGFPGRYPYTRGVRPTMYRSRLWTMREYAGYGTAEETNRRFHFLLEQGKGSMPTGFARREAFIDAWDIAKGSTTELNSRGDAFLAASAVETRLEATLHQYGSFRYGTDWDMGDLVLIRNQERGLSYTARVLEVTKEFSTSAAAPIVTAVIDRPFPTLKHQVAAGSGNAGSGKLDYPVAGLVQTGAISPSPTTTAPTGYLSCDDSAVSRTTYADLFALIGTTFGVGDGSTTFNLPNLVGQVEGR